MLNLPHIQEFTYSVVAMHQPYLTDFTNFMLNKFMQLVLLILCVYIMKTDIPQIEYDGVWYTLLIRKKQEKESP
jgi:hypothetical protein